MASPAWLTTGPASALCQALASARPSLPESAVVRAIGGCVRDWLLERPAQDIDLASILEPEEAAAVLRAAGFSVIPTGLDHGTITARRDGVSVEVTTLRRDVETDGRHAVVRFTTDWAEDAARRDFTMNALSLSRDGQLFDYCGGAEDARAGRLRFIGLAEERIAEDALRLLRYFRFLARYGRAPLTPYTVDTDALAACRSQAWRLQGLSPERVGWELRKWLAADRAAQAWRLMLFCDVQPVPLPSDADRLQRLVDAEIALGRAPQVLVRLAAAYAGAAADSAVLEAALRLSKREAARVAPLLDPAAPLALAPLASLLRRAYRDGAEAVADRLVLGVAAGLSEAAPVRDALAALEAWQRPRLPVDGRDALALGAAGPAVGRALGAIEAWWLAADFAPDRAACLQRLEAELAQG